MRPRPHLATVSAFALFVSVVASTGAGLAAQTWQLAAPVHVPPARAGQAMATDATLGQVVMFGGYAGATYLGDTWVFDGSDWTMLAGAAPPGRMRCAMAHDDGHNGTIMFGGINGTGTNNWLPGTWELANGTWTQRASATNPPRRFGHAMAYDPTRGRIVMFGGRTNAGTIFLQDTWEWDGTTWIFVQPLHAPSNRMGHSMAFDPNLGRVVLFGGLQLGGPFQNDTWAWDGADWALLPPAVAPSPRGDHAMATDSARGRVVLRGGYDGTDLADTWEWNGTAWQQVTPPTQPGVLALAAMATGPTGRHVVLFGGEDASGVTQATWRYGDLAEARAFGSGCGSPALTLAAAPGSQPVLGQTFTSAIGGVVGGGLPLVALGQSHTAFGGLPLPMELTALGMTGCRLYQDLVLMGLTCTGSGSTWTQALPLPAIPALAGRELYTQAYALAPGANPAGLTTSNALALVLGLP